MKGLYILGEILDYDGLCGGFNLDNAWQTALLASENIMLKMLDCGPFTIKNRGAKFLLILKTVQIFPVIQDRIGIVGIGNILTS